MRLLLPVLALPLLVPAATSAETPAAAVRTPLTTPDPLAVPDTSCRKTASHHAELGSGWRGDPVTPRKLGELPPAESYKAVYRTVNGCEEPMTVAEYQRGVIR
jgi:hypothetical protein